MMMKIVSPQIMKYLAPSLKSKNYHNDHVLPPPKIVINDIAKCVDIKEAFDTITMDKASCEIILDEK